MSGRTTTLRVDDMSCDEIAAHAVAERYLLAELSEPDRDAYEHHYFSCERCFQELTTLGALRNELTAAGPPAIGSSPPSQRGLWPGWLGVAAVLVLGAGLWTMRPVRQAGPPPGTGAIEPTATPQATVAATPPPPRPVEPAVTLAALASFAPPPYVAPVLRGSEDEARKLFHAAMVLYTAGAHERAVDGLRAAASKDRLAADASFFLGVSLLLTRQTEAGITELKRTIALGDSPYLELQMGDVSAASRELRSMIALGGDRQLEAKQLLSQIDRARKER
jgi:anti-sigma factor RsiW